MHYWRFRQHGDPIKKLDKPTKPKFCNVQDCKNPPNGKKGMCNAHYLRSYRYGDPLIQKKITNGVAQKWLIDHISYNGNDCLIWPYAKNSDGRGAINHEISPQAHRVMCVLAHGKPPSDIHEAAHSCGKGHEACVNPSHLRWATPLENAADKYIHGTIIFGEGRHNSKLTDHSVKMIRSMRGMASNKSIGILFGVKDDTIREVLSGETWSHVR